MKRLLYLQLFVVFSLSAGPTYASGTDCREELERGGYTSILIDEPPPEVHVDNYRIKEKDMVSKLGTKITLSKEHILANDIVFSFDDQKTGILFQRMSQDEKFVALKQIDGDPVYYSRYVKKTGKVVLTAISKKQVPSELWEPELLSQPEPPRNFSVKSIDPGLLSLRMAQAQVSASLESNDSTHEVLVEAMFHANMETLDWLQHNETLTSGHLEVLNYSVNSALDYGNFELDGQYYDVGILTGIIRGSPARAVNFMNHNYLVDIRGLQVAAPGSVDYIPASDVPKAVDDLLKRVNSVNRSTSVLAILSIYRRFILIHPFVDGNGRTARLLLDYMLLKAGFAPAPHDKNTIRNVIFHTPQETYVNFVKAYWATETKGSAPAPK